MNIKRSSPDTLIGMLMFLAFTMAMVIVLILGARAYRSITSNLKSQYEERTVVGYIAAKVRHYDAAGAVYTGNYAGSDALFLEESYDGVAFTTIIYQKDGYLRELFCEKGLDTGEDAGMAVISADELVVRENNGLVFIGCRVGEKTEEIGVALRSAGGEAA